jgi:hypothetical protein
MPATWQTGEWLGAALRKQMTVLCAKIDTKLVKRSVCAGWAAGPRAGCCRRACHRRGVSRGQAFLAHASPAAWIGSGAGAMATAWRAQSAGRRQGGAVCRSWRAPAGGASAVASLLCSGVHAEPPPPLLLEVARLGGKPACRGAREACVGGGAGKLGVPVAAAVAASTRLSRAGKLLNAPSSRCTIHAV